jgi:hypothetical protein
LQESTDIHHLNRLWQQLDLDSIQGHGISPFWRSYPISGIHLPNWPHSWRRRPGSDFLCRKMSRALIEADRELAEPAAPEIVPIIASEDLDEIERVLALVNEWHHQNQLLAGKADLSHFGQQLAIAIRLMRSGLSAELASMTPAELHAHAQTRIEIGEAVLKVIRTLAVPGTLVSTIDRHRDCPLAVAVQVGAKVRDASSWVPPSRTSIQRNFGNSSGIGQRLRKRKQSGAPIAGYTARRGQIEIIEPRIGKHRIKKAWATMRLASVCRGSPHFGLRRSR